jgi:ComF family protein
MAQLIGAFQRSLDLILPPLTLDGGAPAQGLGLSPAAFSRITFLEAPVCDGCGAPFELDFGLGARCTSCVTRPRPFTRARAACIYDEASRDLVLKLKHGDRPDLGTLFAGWLQRAGAELLADADALVPVPLHPRRLLARRYNQAAEIARPLARRTGIAYLPDSLVRIRASNGQGGRSAVGRVANVAGAFAVDPARRPTVAGRQILLIDDVFTTGATVQACAEALRAAGAAGVDVLTVARVREAVPLSI